jgi:hypothetical protein
LGLSKNLQSLEIFEIDKDDSQIIEVIDEILQDEDVDVQVTL